MYTKVVLLSISTWKILGMQRVITIIRMLGGYKHLIFWSTLQLRVLDYRKLDGNSEIAIIRMLGHEHPILFTLQLRVLDCSKQDRNSEIAIIRMLGYEYPILSTLQLRVLDYSKQDGNF